VQVECLITQLLFEHSLRIRVKAETSDPTETHGDASVTPANEPVTPDSQSVAETQEASESDTLAHSQGNTETTINAPGDVKPDKSAKETKEDGASKASNLTGKITNLVTTDLKNITEARDFLFILIYIPLQAILCMTFLYWILGWRYAWFRTSVTARSKSYSAMVGLAVMVACLPLPGYIVKFIQQVQVARMKSTDARVEKVSESMRLCSCRVLYFLQPSNSSRQYTTDDQALWLGGQDGRKDRQETRGRAFLHLEAPGSLRHE
jgi:hypothetical protein